MHIFDILLKGFIPILFTNLYIPNDKYMLQPMNELLTLFQSLKSTEKAAILSLSESFSNETFFKHDLLGFIPFALLDFVRGIHIIAEEFGISNTLSSNGKISFVTQGYFGLF